MNIAHPLNYEEAHIFFDESGTGSDKPSTMGGLFIPASVYDTPVLQSLNERLLNRTISSLHWTDYTGHSGLKNDIIEVITAFSEIAAFTKMNVINYDRSSLDQRYKITNDPGSQKLSRSERKKIMNYATLMIYTKIPERIFYGLLRHFGKDVFIQTNIYIEREGKYEKYDLPLRLQENLNTQSLYRSEQYWIHNCEMIEKGNMIGIEIVDLLLGVIRLIIKNKEIPSSLTSENDPVLKGSKGLYYKTLLVIELLKIPLFKSFMEISGFMSGTIAKY